jgi:hypothetical protein
MHEIQSVRSAVSTHYRWLNLKAIPCIHGEFCSDQDYCERQWEAGYHATVLWLLHRVPRHRLDGAGVLSLFANLRVPGVGMGCLSATLPAVASSKGFTKDSNLIAGGVKKVLEMYR